MLHIHEKELFDFFVTDFTLKETDLLHVHVLKPLPAAAFLKNSLSPTAALTNLMHNVEQRTADSFLKYALISQIITSFWGLFSVSFPLLHSVRWQQIWLDGKKNTTVLHY